MRGFFLRGHAFEGEAVSHCLKLIQNDESYEGECEGKSEEDCFEVAD